MGRAFAKILAERGFGLILIDLKFEKLRQTELYLQDIVKSQLFIKLIVVKPSGIKSGEVSHTINMNVQKLSKFSIECFINAF